MTRFVVQSRSLHSLAKLLEEIGMSFWNLPNSLTVARVGMVPIVVVLMYFEGVLPARICAVLFVAAAITDGIDGWLARKYGMTSVMGAFLDPLADKLMVMSAMIMLISLDRIPPWMVVVLLSRDLAITGLRGVASAQGVLIAASKWGKWKTGYQMTALSFLLFHYQTLWFDAHIVGTYLLLIAMVISLFSGVDYMKAFVATLKKSPSPAAPSTG